MNRFAVVVLLLCAFGRFAHAEPAPHIVFILTDDLGAGDLVCYGGTVAATPHIDRLANFSKALRGESLPRTRPLFWEYGRNDKSFKFPGVPHRSPNVAMLDGRWKLLVNTNGTGAELYDLVADPKEAKNLAAGQPDTAAKMKAAALAWWNALPKTPSAN